MQAACNILCTAPAARWSPSAPRFNLSGRRSLFNHNLRVHAVSRPQAFDDLAKCGAAVLLSGALALSTGPAQAGVTFEQLQSMSYKGTGLANTCPIILDGSPAPAGLKAGSYRMERFCMEPTSFKVKEESAFKGGEPEFVDTRLLTRMTYTLDGMSGMLNLGRDGQIEMVENEDGMDYAAVTVKLRGGEEVPFLFSIKNLHAKGTSDGMRGEFDVPAYRGSSFMDPKGRGGSTGYDFHTGLQAETTDKFDRQDAKTATPRRGMAVMAVSRVDEVTGEVAGVFASVQPASDDQGAKEPTDVLIQGVWYAQLQEV